MEKVKTERSKESIEIRRKTEKRKKSKWARRCLKEIERRKSKWMRERRAYIEERRVR